MIFFLATLGKQSSCIIPLAEWNDPEICTPSRAEQTFYIFTAFMALMTTAGVPCPGKEVSPISA